LLTSLIFSVVAVSPSRAEVPRFVRGDANADGGTDIADAVYALLALFTSRVAPTCDDAVDTDDSGVIDVSDPIYFLQWQFRGGNSPPAPGRECGVDPTDDGLGCEAYSPCPVNEDPTAALTAEPLSGEAPLEVSFDASASSDPDGIAGYRWDFGDGSGPQELPETTTHTFAEEGDYTVTLTVTDDELGVDTAEVLVRVDPPVSRPTVSGLALTEPVVRGDIATLHFDWSDDDEDIAVVRFTMEDAAQSRSEAVSASVFDFEGPSGTTQFEFGTHDIPFGPLTVAIQLVDTVGNEGNIATATVQVVGNGAGGSAPTIVRFESLRPRQDRPAGPLAVVDAPFAITFDDADADAAWVRTAVLAPGENATSREIPLADLNLPGTVADVARNLHRFTAESGLGTYLFEMTLIDRAGNESATAAATVELVETGGSVALSIAGFSPQTGGAGTEVTITGTGFDADDLEHNYVELDSAVLSVQSVAPDSMAVVIPAGVETGAFTVTNGNGYAIAPTQFVVPPSITLSPESGDIAVGESVQMEALVIPFDGSVLEWSVAGVVGGDATVGTITADGLYTAPGDVPDPASVDLVASLVGDGAVFDTATLTILPPPSRPGAAEILRSVGGRVVTPEGFSWIDIPPLALPANTMITIDTIHPAILDSPPEGKRLLGAVDLGPDGLVFDSPATVTISLSNRQLPGTELTLAIYDEMTGEHVEEGVAIVDESGVLAQASIAHFTVVTALGDGASPPLPPPFIATLDSPVYVDELINPGYDEGRIVPFLITGSGLTSDLQASVVDSDGVVDTRFVVDQLHVLGNRAGVRVAIPVLPDLPAGLVGLVRHLRLARDGGGYHQHRFVVRGLDELEVPYGDTIELSGDHRFSRVLVDGTLRVPYNTELNLEVTGEVIVSGMIDAAGRAGDHASGTGGAPRNPETNTGRGGHGRRDNGCFHDLVSKFCDDWDEAEDENFGQHGNYCEGFPADPRRQGRCDRLSGSGRTQPRGMGGWPGVNAGLDVGDLLAAAACLDGDFQACVEFGLEITRLAGAITDLTEGRFVGGRGFGAVRNFEINEWGQISSHGGGGGGGGRMSVDAVVAAARLYGGGGGAGGAGGRPVRIRCPGAIDVTGSITAEGGAGGNGSRHGALQYDVFFGLASASGELTGVPASPGGGGGGGRGGDLQVLATTSLTVAAPNRIRNFGGEAGAGGITVIDPENGNLREAFRFSPASGGPIGEHLIRGPALAASDVSNMVTNRLILRVSPIRHGSISVTPEGQSPVGYDVRTGVPKTILLGQGFNRVVDPSTIELLVKHVLVLAPDRDNDGLSDADETELTNTDPDDPDTDDDGLNDGHEIALGTHPLGTDSDDDGLSDGDEVITLSTDPLDDDSDGDDFSDGAEVILGSNPLWNAETPEPPEPGDILVQSGPDLFVLDPASGRAGKLGSVPGLGFGHGFDGDGVYVMALTATSELTEAETLTATLDAVRGPLETSGGEVVLTLQLTYHDDDELFYGVQIGFGGPTGQLVSVHPQTAEVTRIGAPLPGPIYGILALDDGRLLAAIAKDATTDTLVELDRTSGGIAATIGDIGTAGVFGLLQLNDDTLLALGDDPDSGVRTPMLLIDIATGVGTFSKMILGRQYFALAEVQAPGGGSCGPLTFGGRFDAPDYLPGFGAGDIDNDGKADVLACIPEEDAVVLYTEFDGADFTVSELAVFLPVDVEVARLDETSAPGGNDVIVATADDNEIQVHFFDGGSVAIPFQGGGDISRVEVGDFDGDDHLDLLATGEDSISVWNGDGAGGFSFDETVPEYQEGIAIGDFNGDGRDDFVIIAWDMYTYASEPTGFALDQTLSVDAGFYSVDVGDMNGDGILDIVACGLERRRYYVYLGNESSPGSGVGDGTFQGPIWTAAPGPHYPFRTVVLDVDVDGKTDVISVDQGSPSQFAWMRGDGVGGLVPGDPLYYSLDPEDSWFLGAEQGDVDGDGSIDVIVPVEFEVGIAYAREITVYLNACR